MKIHSNGHQYDVVFSERHAVILRALIDGKQPKEIAFDQKCSRSWINMQLHEVRKLLDAKTTIQAVATAIRRNLVT